MVKDQVTQKTGQMVMMVIVYQLSELPTSQPAVPRTLHSVLGGNAPWVPFMDNAFLNSEQAS